MVALGVAPLVFHNPLVSIWVIISAVVIGLPAVAKTLAAASSPLSFLGFAGLAIPLRACLSVREVFSVSGAFRTVAFEALFCVGAAFGRPSGLSEFWVTASFEPPPPWR